MAATQDIGSMDQLHSLYEAQFLDKICTDPSTPVPSEVGTTNEALKGVGNLNEETFSSPHAREFVQLYKPPAQL